MSEGQATRPGHSNNYKIRFLLSTKKAGEVTQFSCRRNKKIHEGVWKLLNLSKIERISEDIKEAVQ